MKRLFPIICVLSCLLAVHSFAGSATWSANPANGDWNMAANWTPATVPNGLTDIATFGASGVTQVSIRTAIVLSNIEFAANASAFTIRVTRDDGELDIESGVENHSSSIQNFYLDADMYNGATIFFLNSASAGTLTNYTVAGNIIYFRNTSTAGNASFNNNNSTGSGEEFDDESSAGNAVFMNDNQGGVGFYYNSTADHATFIDNPGVDTAAGGETGFHFSSNAGYCSITNNGSSSASNLAGFGCATFEDSSNAANATITNNGSSVSNGTGGMTIFTLGSGAGNSTLIANGGTNGGGGGSIQFKLSSTGDTARAQLFGNGSLNIAGRYAPGVTIGSIEGDGSVVLGSQSLTVGSNNLSTKFDGVIQGAGSFTKLGTGTLALSGANIYEGGTTLSAGTLKVNNITGSATGSGAVTVQGGSLAGQGIISGPVTIGSGSGSGPSVAPGKGESKPTTLTLQSTLTFEADGNYTYKLNTKKAKADRVVANGVTIQPGAQFNFNPVGNKKLTGGKVFTALSNTAATPIGGTFANLPDGSTVSLGVNKLLVSYSDGDGNDLTLTVVQ